jgi:hypothetical protein
MPTATAIERSKADIELMPYPPSWLDTLTAWVARLPGGVWLYYLCVAAFLFLAQTAILWAEGALPVGAVLPTHAFVAVVIPFVLALLYYLDRRADRVLVALKPLLTASEAETLRLRYELTTLPAWPTLVASLAGAAFVIATGQLLGMPQSYQELADKPVSSALMYAMYVAVWWVFGAFLYHTVRQARVIDRIYTEHTQISLFRMKPLYGFSGVTAITAVSLAATIYGWYFLNPSMLTDPIALAIGFVITLTAVMTFAWPLLGVHRLLGEEKDRRLGETALRIEATISALHRRVDNDSLEGMQDMHETIASLEIEQKLLEKIPTWPWQPETVQLLITALALPLGLWLLQYILQLLIGD